MINLCLKNEPVLSLSDRGGVIGEIIKIDNPELLPLSLKDNCTTENFKKWLDNRCVPSQRDGYNGVKARFNDRLQRSWNVSLDYMSLSDHYWIRRRADSEKWGNKNFFTNAYKDDFGKLFFSPWEFWNAKKIPRTPGWTTGGVLKKMWVQNKDFSSYLIKAGDIHSYNSEDKDNGSKQDPLSEVLVSVFAERLGIIKTAEYELCTLGVEICCKCNNFITKDTDLVLCSDIYNALPKEENETVYSHILKVAEYFDIPNVEDFLDAMIFIDRITGNQDRNLGNIAFIRNINTMKFIGPSPLFDCGNAFWSTKPIAENATKSRLFGDVEGDIFKKVKPKCNLEYAFSDIKIKSLIEKYPNITDFKKENLIDAWSKREALLTNRIEQNR